MRKKNDAVLYPCAGCPVPIKGGMVITELAFKGNSFFHPECAPLDAGAIDGSRAAKVLLERNAAPKKKTPKPRLSK